MTPEARNHGSEPAPRAGLRAGTTRDSEPEFVPPGQIEAATVAEAWLHHRFVTALERRMSSPRPASQAELADLLEVSENQLGRRLRGEAHLTLRHVATLAMVFGVELLGELAPPIDDELFPPNHRGYLGNWTSGMGRLPTFATSADGFQARVSAELVRRCRQMSSRQVAVLTAGALLAQIVVPASERHAASAPVWVEQNLGSSLDPTVVDLILGAPTDTVACVGCVPDSRLASAGERLRGVATLAGALFRSAGAPLAASRYVWLVTGSDGLSALAERDEGLDFRSPTGAARVSSNVIAAMEQLVVPNLAPVPAGMRLHLSWTNRPAGRLYVVALTVDKIELVGEPAT